MSLRYKNFPDTLYIQIFLKYQVTSLKLMCSLYAASDSDWKQKKIFMT